MYLGRVVETGTYEEICDNPRHPYTQALVSAIPVPDPKVERRRSRIVLQGDVPSPLSPPSGCPFHTRCPVAREDRCRDEVPRLREVDGRAVSCHHVEEIGDLTGRSAAVGWSRPASTRSSGTVGTDRDERSRPVSTSIAWMRGSFRRRSA